MSIKSCRTCNWHWPDKEPQACCHGHGDFRPCDERGWCEDWKPDVRHAPDSFGVVVREDLMVVSHAEPDTLVICMTRGERSIRDAVTKAFGAFRRVVLDVDGERHEYDADALIALLERLEVHE